MASHSCTPSSSHCTSPTLSRESSLHRQASRPQRPPPPRSNAEMILTIQLGPSKASLSIPHSRTPLAPQPYHPEFNGIFWLLGFRLLGSGEAKEKHRGIHGSGLHKTPFKPTGGHHATIPRYPTFSISPS